MIINTSIGFYGAADFKPKEELFDLKKDPFEQKDLAEAKKQAKQLKKMQGLYDDWLQVWEQDVVAGAGYEKYVRLGNRSIPFTDNDPLEIKDMYDDPKANKGAKDKKSKKAKKDKKKKE